MNRLLKALKARHAIVEARVMEEQRRPKPDHVSVRALKTIKLQLRDQIASLERMLAENTAPVTDRLRHKRRNATS
ncbi:MAG: YdcH family protein [Pseudomonadota bacterium]|nr:YdcH family protein [Hyphomicrobiales bacterium]MDY6963994.1 YdcH family protein [Pseudomonadota bacterium]